MGLGLEGGKGWQGCKDRGGGRRAVSSVCFPLPSTELKSHTTALLSSVSMLPLPTPAAVDGQGAASPLGFPTNTACSGVATHSLRHLSSLLLLTVCCAPSQIRLSSAMLLLQTPCNPCSQMNSRQTQVKANCWPLCVSAGYGQGCPHTESWALRFMAVSSREALVVPSWLSLSPLPFRERHIAQPLSFPRCFLPHAHSPRSPTEHTDNQVINSKGHGVSVLTTAPTPLLHSCLPLGLLSCCYGKPFCGR